MTDWVLSILSRNARLSAAWSNVSKFIRTKFWWYSGLIRIPGSTPARRRLAPAPERKVCKIVRGVITAPWGVPRSEEHTSELQSLMRISYAVFCLKKKRTTNQHKTLIHSKNKQPKIQ